MGPFGVSASRAEVVDYTGFIVIDYARIIGGRGRAEVDPWGFLLPLAPEVWLGVAAMTALAMATAAVLTGLSERFSPGRRSAGLCFSFVRVLLFQGECELPHVYVNTESAFAMKAELHYAQGPDDAYPSILTQMS